MGLAKVSLMSLPVAMAANLRLADTFAANQAKEQALKEAGDAGVVEQVESSCSGPSSSMRPGT